MNRLALLAAGASTLAACAIPRSSAISGMSLEGDLDDVTSRAKAVDFAPGLGVAVYSGRGRYARGFGVTDLRIGERASADAAFH